MGKYDSYILDHFSKINGMLGGDLNQLLISEFSIKPDNARKVIQRLCDDIIIWSTKPLSFGKGQYYYYLPGRSPSMDDIKLLFKVNRPPVYRLLQLIDDCDGVISFYEGLKVSSSPDESSNTKVSLLKDIVNDLAKLKLVVERKDDFGVNFILKRLEIGNVELDYQTKIIKHKESLKIDSLFISDLMGWLLDVNLIATFGAHRSISNLGFGVNHNNLSWDAYAYTKATGINPGMASSSIARQKQTLVVIDCVISREYTLIDLDGFLSRIQINNNSVKEHLRRTIPILFYHTMNDRVLNTAKKLGFIIFSLQKIYGKNIGKLILDIKSVYNENNEHLRKNIEVALERISASGQSDKLKSLRGALFEALMRPVFETLFPKAIFYPGKILKHPDTGKIREFDYIIISTNPKELIFVELKGHEGSSFIRVGDSETKNTLRYFFRGSVPLGEAFYKNGNFPEGCLSKAIFITTGGFHFDGNEFIEDIEKSKLVPTSLGKSIYNGEALLELLKKKDFNYEIALIKKYYIELEET